MDIGRKVYYDKATGNVILDTGERSGNVRPTTVAKDIASYSVLSQRNKDSFGVIELAFGQYSQDFMQSTGYRVNPQTKIIEFTYTDSGESTPNEPTPEPAYTAPLTEQIANLEKENALLKAQNQAVSERADFIEDLIAELAKRVYQ
ncbi:hypothetical protein [Priestia endophytica]|uniref:hypothetical protein n=1 Tax=Priestia endophytica TaxID=135735 RepID=UPI0018D5925B|nr:hypothetical protein [Priestia endophytica]